MVSRETVRSRIPPLGHEELCLPFTLHLIVLNFFMLVNAVHQLMLVLSRLYSKGFP